MANEMNTPNTAASRFFMSILLAVFLIPNFAAAQASKGLVQGQRIRVMYRYQVLGDRVIDCGESLSWQIDTGQLQAFDGDTLRIRTESSNGELAIPAGCVVRLWVYKGKKGNSSRGAIIGLAAGMVIGGIIGSTQEFCIFDCGPATALGFLIGAPAGAFLGAGVGTGFRSDHWKEVRSWANKSGNAAR